MEEHQEQVAAAQQTETVNGEERKQDHSIVRVGEKVGAMLNARPIENELDVWLDILKEDENYPKIHLNTKVELATWVVELYDQKRKTDVALQEIAEIDDTWESRLRQTDVVIDNALRQFKDTTKQLMARVMAALQTIGPFTMSHHYLLTKSKFEKYFLYSFLLFG